MCQTKKVSGVATRVTRSFSRVEVRYHSTTVAMKDLLTCVVTLDSGGWRTATTKLRMNQFAREFCGGEFAVVQRDFAWFVTTPSGTIPFEDGIEIQLGGVQSGIHFTLGEGNTPQGRSSQTDMRIPREENE
jgi:hypothetical protein